MREEGNILSRIDWLTVLIYLALVIIGWMNIYSTNHDDSQTNSIFNLDINAGRQFIFICISLVIVTAILLIDFRVYDSFGIVFYLAALLALVVVLILAREVSGSRSWIELGPIKFQPSEFAKFATALAVAKIISLPGFRFEKTMKFFQLVLVIAVPALLIILQGDTGTALVFAAFAIPLFREGLNPGYLIIGISAAVIFILTLFIPELYLYIAITAICVLIIFLGKKTIKRIATIAVAGIFIGLLVTGVDYFINNVLKPHQQARIKALIDPESDPRGYGYNVIQSKIAIGSGGFWGKGYLQGTQTKYEYVPEQTTDFIFCTIGEEGGWVGSTIIIGLFLILLIRLVRISERQKSKFARVYGYCVCGIMFFHFMVNVGMTIGFFPVIGIPLPFFSYGGSSLLAFSILLFILIKIDAHRMQMLTH